MIRLALALSLFVLSACGFTPMYGSGAPTQAGVSTSVAAGLDQIAIDVIPNAEGVALRNQLIDRFYRNGYPDAPRYKLTIAPLVKTTRDLDLTLDSESTSRRITMTTKITLVDLQGSGAVLERDVMAYASYNVLGSQFTTRVSERDAMDAALSDLARQIETQVALYLSRATR